MDKGRNTDDLAHQVFCECTGVYLELDLQTTLCHPLVLLGSFPLRKLYHPPMLLWRTGLWWVWMWWGDTGSGALMMKVLLSCRLDFWHWHWSVGCVLHWDSQDSHHLNWWTLINSVKCCDVCIYESRALHGALELLVIAQSLLDWSINPLLWRHGIFMGLCWEGWGCWIFHFHSHSLHPSVQAQFKKHHSGWSQSDWRVYLLVHFIFLVCSHYRRRLCRLDLWHY